MTDIESAPVSPLHMDRHGGFVTTLDVHEPDQVALGKLRRMLESDDIKLMHTRR